MIQGGAEVIGYLVILHNNVFLVINAVSYCPSISAPLYICTYTYLYKEFTKLCFV